MKKQSLTVKDSAVLSNNRVLKKKIVSDTSKANYGRKKEKPKRARRKSAK
jgi:hypothetical protein